MTISDLNAEKKWRKLPKEFREQLVRNVFCSKCKATTMENYSVFDDDHGIVLRGVCKSCGGKVVRFVENE